MIIIIYGYEEAFWLDCQEEQESSKFASEAK